MNDSDLSRIEAVTGLELPRGYRRLLQELPPELVALLAFDKPDDRMLFTDVATIVHWNKFFRSPDYEYENSQGEMCKFPANHIVIGSNSGGDFYHIDARNERTRVLFWCHEDGEITECSKNLSAFVHEIFFTTADAILYGLDLS